MMDWLGSLFGQPEPIDWKEKAMADEQQRVRFATGGLGLQQTPDWLTPERVEQLIDEAGRGEVFARARALGWSQAAPPLWVWQQIALEVKANRMMEDQQRLAGMKPQGFA